MSISLTHTKLLTFWDMRMQTQTGPPQLPDNLPPLIVQITRMPGLPVELHYILSDIEETARGHLTKWQKSREKALENAKLREEDNKIFLAGDLPESEDEQRTLLAERNKVFADEMEKLGEIEVNGFRSIPTWMLQEAIDKNRSDNPDYDGITVADILDSPTVRWWLRPFVVIQSKPAHT